MKHSILFFTFLCSTVFTCLHAFTAADNKDAIVQDVLTQTNLFRKSKGLPPLIIREDLNAIAAGHSENMASKRAGFGHTGFAKRNALAGKTIRPLQSFAENVAYGATTGKAVVTMWKNSPGHRRNMLGQYKYIGIGIAKDKKGRVFYTQVFAG